MNLLIKAAILAMAVMLPISPATALSETVPCARASELCEGTLTVPLDPENATGEHLSIAYTWVPADDATGTVLVLPGGPAPSLWAVENTRAWLNQALDHQNLLMLDQRGWGRSSPLSCPGLDVSAPATVRACGERLGARAPFYNTANAVRDIEALRAALGVPRFTVYGYSWGTLFGRAYAARYPGRVSAVAFDSVLGIDTAGYADMAFSTAARRGVDDLGKVCLPSLACRALPGEPVDRWAKLTARLRSHPDPLISVRDLARLTGNLSEPLVGRQVNAAAEAYLRGDGAPLRRLVTEFAAPPDAPSDPAMLAYVCADAALPYDRKASPAERRAELERQRAGRPAWPYTVAEALGGYGEIADWCLVWPLRDGDPPIPAGTRYPRVPAVTFGGGLDVAAPALNAVRAARQFGGSAVTVPFGAHVGASFGTSDYHTCLRGMLTRFLTHTDRSRGRCSAENYRAAGRFPRTSAGVPQARADALSPDARRLLAAAFATVDDAAARHNPNSALASAPAALDGLRGGRISHQPRKITLNDDRFLADVAVTGEIILDEAARATATLDVERGVTKAHIALTWSPFDPSNAAAVTGVLNGIAFHGSVPRL